MLTKNYMEQIALKVYHKLKMRHALNEQHTLKVQFSLKVHYILKGHFALIFALFTKNTDTDTRYLHIWVISLRHKKNMLVLVKIAIL